MPILSPMARLKTLGSVKVKKESRVENIRQDLSWPREKLEEKPWMLVVGPESSGKKTFIQTAFKMLGKLQPPSRQEYVNEDWTLTMSPQSSDILLRKLTIPQDVEEIEQQVKLVQDLMEYGESRSSEGDMMFRRPLVVVFVLKTAWEVRTEGRMWKDAMLKIKQTAKNIGLPSCLVLTHAAGPLGDELARLAGVDRKSPLNLKGIEVLGMPHNRVFLVDVCLPRKLKKKDKMEELYLAALEALAVDFREQIRNTMDTQQRAALEGTVPALQRAECPPPPSSSQECGTCRTFMDKLTDAHVFALSILTDWDHGQWKLRPNDLRDFYKTVNGLLNSLEGGSICLHLDSRFHEMFREQVQYPLTQMLPIGCLEHDTYVTRFAANHVFFSVTTAGEGGRSLSTLDFHIMVSRDVGLVRATQSLGLEVIKNSLREQNAYPYTPVDDPVFVYNKPLPEHFKENSSRQMKQCQREDIECYCKHRKSLSSAPREGDPQKAKKLSDMLARYIHAFALQKRGGILYLGLSEEKLAKPNVGGKMLSNASDKDLSKPVECCTRQSGVDDKDLIRTGRFLCSGLQLNQQERRAFEAAVETEVESMSRYSLCNSSPDVGVSFPEVRDADSRMCIVKITVKPFHGVLWPQSEGPVAYKVKHGHHGSQIVPVNFSEWLDAFKLEN